MRSNYLPLPSDAKWRRLAAVVLFGGLLYFLRELAPVFICFTILVRALTLAADFIHDRTGMERRGGVASILLLAVAVLAGSIFAGVRELIPRIRELRVEGRELAEHLLDHPVVDRLRHMAGTEGGGGGAAETIKAHAMEALHYATAFAHLALYLLIGFLLSVIYLFERDEIDHWLHTLEPESVSGTMTRWLGYVGDAIAITVKMQGVTALVNAVITFPVLLVLGLPHKALLFLLILVSGLLPVVGNFIAGTVLCVVAYEERGAWAVGVMLGVTFVLHKIESYYLTPRLAAQHVKLPGLILVLSLLTFEETFGFVGLFLSFPALYVATRIHREWSREDAPDARAATAPSSAATEARHLAAETPAEKTPVEASASAAAAATPPA
jgi:predicted PurR-regulated permease PerM